MLKHLRGVAQGQKFVYCPVNHAVSWHPEDYNNKWCFTENKFVEEME